MTTKLRIATRQSPMALWQANFIRDKLQNIYPELYIELIPFVTQGDKELQKALSDVGGKSLFVKELQRALLDNEADIAVHCIKDMSANPTPELTLTCICKRDDPRDVFVSNTYQQLEDLPDNSCVGTASPRRQCLLKHYYPKLQTKLLRGNVNTRLAKLDNGEFDAIILAAAGLHRLGFDKRISDYLDPERFVPAIAQGALGIECRSNDSRIIELLKPLHDHDSADCINAERHVNQMLNGDCFTPLGAYATLSADTLMLRAVVGTIDGSNIITTQQQGARKDAVGIGKQVAEALLQQGANTLLQQG